MKNRLNKVLLLSISVSICVFSTEKPNKNVSNSKILSFLDNNKHALITIGSLSVVFYILLNRHKNDNDKVENPKKIKIKKNNNALPINNSKNLSDQTDNNNKEEIKNNYSVNSTEISNNIVQVSKQTATSNNKTEQKLLDNNRSQITVTTETKQTEKDQVKKLNVTTQNTNQSISLTTPNDPSNNQQKTIIDNQRPETTIVNNSNNSRKEEIDPKRRSSENIDKICASVDSYKNFVKTGFFPLDEYNNKIHFTTFDPQDEKQIILNKILTFCFSSENKDLISAVICSLSKETKQCYFNELIGNITQKTYFGEHQIKIIESLLDSHGFRFYDKKESKCALIQNNPYDIVINNEHVVLSLRMNSSALLKRLIGYVQKTAPENLYTFISIPRENIWFYFREYYDEVNIAIGEKIKSVNQRLDFFKQYYPGHQFSINLFLLLRDRQLISLCKHEAKNLFSNNVNKGFSTIFDSLNFYSMEFIQSSNTILSIKKKIKLLFNSSPLSTYLLMQHRQASSMYDTCNKNRSHGVYTFLNLIFSKEERNEILNKIKEVTNKKNNELRIINSYNLDPSPKYTRSRILKDKVKPFEVKESINLEDYF